MNYRFHPAIHHAARHIASGGVLAYPTEGVWGLGADPRNQRAVQTILDLKRRPIGKGLILVAAAAEQFEFILRHLEPAQKAVLVATWPGPNTWLVPHNGEVPYWICGDHSTVALRVSAHPVVRALCERAGPLVSTSANPQGLPPARSSLKARSYFGDQVMYAPGQVNRNAKPSTIRDLATGALVRA
ncbi:MAG: Sua5/YciO/YrdC/YwlC family protein [Cellvibrionaceae bacterium]|nr:Sua5/YciO/YrdC/YwlC family protein [Cellvibrionaceae bacterium]